MADDEKDTSNGQRKRSSLGAAVNYMFSSGGNEDNSSTKKGGLITRVLRNRTIFGTESRMVQESKTKEVKKELMSDSELLDKGIHIKPTSNSNPLYVDASAETIPLNTDVNEEPNEQQQLSNTNYENSGYGGNNKEDYNEEFHDTQEANYTNEVELENSVIVSGNKAPAKVTNSARSSSGGNGETISQTSSSATGAGLLGSGVSTTNTTTPLTTAATIPIPNVTMGGSNSATNERASKKRKNEFPNKTFLNKQIKGMILQLNNDADDGFVNNQFKLNFTKGQVIKINKEYRFGSFDEQLTIQSFLDDGDTRSIPRGEIDISGEKDMIENIIENKGFKISNLYCDCVAFLPPDIEPDDAQYLTPNTISYSSLAYFDDDMKVDKDEAADKLNHNDFKEGFFDGKEIRYLDGKEYHPPHSPILFDDQRNWICQYCTASCGTLLECVNHITKNTCAYGQKYGKILLHEILIIIYCI